MKFGMDRLRGAMLPLMVLLCLGRWATADDFPPINKAELAMTGVPQAPGASAVVLDHIVVDDDIQGVEHHYFRIKILTDKALNAEGLADVKIYYQPFVYSNVGIVALQAVSGIHARTIESDGTIVPFHGKVYDSAVYNHGWGERVNVKSFTLPDVRVGSVLEYKYDIDYSHHWELPPAHWRVQRRHFVVHEHFEMRPRTGSYWGLPPFVPIGITLGVTGLKTHKYIAARTYDTHESYTYTLDVNNLAALPYEPYAPPRRMIQQQVLFYYHNPFENFQVPKEFWRGAAKQWRGKVKSFAHTDGVSTAGLFSPRDSGLVKLQKLYARVLKIKNLDLHPKMSKNELKGAQIKRNHNAADVLSHDYGSAKEINWTLVALARKAGFKAWAVQSSTRDGWTFNPQWELKSQLGDSLVLVRIGKNDYYLNPGAGAAFGDLRWQETDVPDLILDHKAPDFAGIPVSTSEHSQIVRDAQLTLDVSGSLTGTLSVDFTGEEGLLRRSEHWNDDAHLRNKAIKEEIQSWLPGGARLKRMSISGWRPGAENLKSVWQVTIPNFVQRAGDLWLLPQGVLETTEQPWFPAPTRVQPIYFHILHDVVDNVQISLPEGLHAQGLPSPLASPSSQGLRLTLKSVLQGNTLQIHRDLATDNVLFPAKLYAPVRGFFAGVLQADREQIVLSGTPAISTAAVVK